MPPPTALYLPEEMAFDRALREQLPPAFWEAMDDREVTDLDLDEYGRIWIKRFGAYPQDAPDASISRDQAFSIATILSRAADKPLSSDERQSLTCNWPTYSYRTIVTTPPAVRPFPAVHIRTNWAREINGSDLIASGTFSESQWAHITAGFREHRNTIFTGLPGCGKTTAERAALLELTGVDWIVIVLDALNEFAIKARNLRKVSPNKAYSDAVALDDALLKDPGAIAYGEVRTSATIMALIDAWLTGVCGGFAAMHTDDAFGVLVRFANAYRAFDQQPVYADIARVVHTIVHLRKIVISSTEQRFVADEVVDVALTTDNPQSLADFTLVPIP